MQVIDLQNEKMPALGFGTWQLRGNECTQAVKKALEIGYRHVDTAQFYDNEPAVGKGLAEGMKATNIEREDVFLTTKLWRTNFDDSLTSLDKSLKDLQSDYVDLLLAHWPFPEVDMSQIIDTLLKAQESGKARLIGVSNFTVAQMEQAEKLSGGKVCVNQVEYHPYLSQKPVLNFVQKKNWVLTAYSPIARGKVVDDMAIKEIALKYSKSPAQITLRWLIQQDRVVAIPKSATEKNIKSNFEIFDFELSAEDMASISALAKEDGRMIDPDFAPKWDKAA